MWKQLLFTISVESSKELLAVTLCYLHIDEESQVDKDPVF